MFRNLVTVAASKSQRGSSSGRRSHRAINDQATTNIINTSTTDTSSITNRRGSVDGVMQRCGLCSLLSSLLRRAMCVGSRRGSGESYYQELAETAVSFPINIRTLVYLFFHFQFCSSFFLRFYFILFRYFFLLLRLLFWRRLRSRFGVQYLILFPQINIHHVKKRAEQKRALKLIIQHSKWWKIYYNFYLWAFLGFCSVVI